MTIIAQVFKFLWVTVWGKINIWQFLTLNKHYLILAGSNVLLSLLFIYMAEQTTVRTDQYRELKTQIKTHESKVSGLEEKVLLLEKTNRVLVESFAVKKVEVDTEIILDDYNKWAAEVKRLEKDIADASIRLGEIKK